MSQSPSVPPWPGPTQSSWLTSVKLIGVGASTLLLLAVSIRIGGVMAADGSWWLVVPAALLGYLGADLVSGTAHWFCDTFFDEGTPVIGRVLIQPFREHHVYPARITSYRFLEQDTTNFFIMIPALGATLWLGHPVPDNPISLGGATALASLALGSYGTNLFHKWAHASEVPPGVRWLQRRRLILAPDRHRVHHGDHTRGFCVTSGWLNPCLDAVRFFPRLERAARRVFGLQARS